MSTERQKQRPQILELHKVRGCGLALRGTQAFPLLFDVGNVTPSAVECGMKLEYLQAGVFRKRGTEPRLTVIETCT